ncbi:MAG: NADH-quinone oxidoreductase subunit NuoH [Bacteroidaceae bacterium]|nr:NADH-quinone oxidoreductase subunit NuoH [Bacteroidaceae bacterium]MDY6249711.1 NADH-quinone oxidoreductase subunit NuoH [Bacteroidaceae bacterium]
MFDFSVISQWLHNLLLSIVPEWAAILIESVLVALVIITLYAVFAIVLIYMERKICGFFQCRLGPNRVGKWGLLQVFADVFKMLQKEIIKMRQTDRFLHDLAPFFVVTASMLTFACLPWNKGAHMIDFNIGIFFILAVSSVGVVGILLAGWGSNSKYPLIGAMRSGAQIISYELSIGLTMLTMICLTGTMQISEIVEQQAAEGWNIFRGHVPALIAFVIYLIAGNAECNRGPFDLPEAESELTAGYHTEYSGMHFGYFYLAEYLNLFIAAGIASTIFLGGWAPLHIAGLDGFNGVMDAIPGIVWFLGKTFFVVFLFMWERWTLPRLRIDNILSLEWKYLMPISMANLVLMALVVAFKLYL